MFLWSDISYFTSFVLHSITPREDTLSHTLFCPWQLSKTKQNLQYYLPVYFIHDAHEFTFVYRSSVFCLIFFYRWHFYDKFHSFLQNYIFIFTSYLAKACWVYWKGTGIFLSPLQSMAIYKDHFSVVVTQKISGLLKKYWCNFIKILQNDKQYLV
jgi:hypothetical protein